MNTRSLLVGAVLIATAPFPAQAFEEQNEAMAWVAAKFADRSAAEAKPGWLEITDPGETILKQRSPGGPLKASGIPYAHGIYTGGVKRLTVHLAQPAKSFSAIAALDLNWRGRGARNERAVFSIEVEGKTMQPAVQVDGGGTGRPMTVLLNGATEFSLLVSPSSSDPRPVTGLWANAQVVLENGQSVWLDELPVAPLNTGPSRQPPFSFTYGGKASDRLLGSWEVARSSRSLDRDRTEYTVQWRDRESGLAVRAVAVSYGDYPAIEWTLFFRNEGRADTPVLENIQALDTVIERDGDGEFLLHHFKGSQTSPTDYEPRETSLIPGARADFLSEGRPTSKELCYFDVAWPGKALLIGLGWPGQWSAGFMRDGDRGLRLQAGQGHTHFRLHPGEEARSPLVVLLFSRGDWIRAQNTWRRWMLAHNSPRPANRPLGQAFWSCFNSLEFADIDERKNVEALDRLLAAGIKPDFWELDAGWYVNNGQWTNTGTWTADPIRFPHGLDSLLRAIHSRGLKTQVWFEPERVNRGTALWNDHPEWLLRCPQWEHTENATDPDRQAFRDNRLLNLGNPEARRWLVSLIDGYVRKGIDFYRTDFNFDPLPFWQAADAADPDRQGLTENKYVTGFLGYLDDLMRLHPNLMFDTCASGGRRIDLETLRRGFPVTRSDYFAEPAGAQNLTYGIAFWIPRYGTGTIGFDRYTNRSAWGPWPGIAWDLRRPGLDLGALRQMAEECRSLESYFYGDYYPLTEYHSTNDVWMAWQFDRPELGTGMIQAFRRADSAYDSAVLQLHGLVPDAEYEIVNLDRPGTTLRTGQSLLESGLKLSLPEAPLAQILLYRKLTKKNRSSLDGYR